MKCKKITSKSLNTFSVSIYKSRKKWSNPRTARVAVFSDKSSRKCDNPRATRVSAIGQPGF